MKLTYSTITKKFSYNPESARRKLQSLQDEVEQRELQLRQAQEALMNGDEESLGSLRNKVDKCRLNLQKSQLELQKFQETIRYNREIQRINDRLDSIKSRSFSKRGSYKWMIFASQITELLNQLNSRREIWNGKPISIAVGVLKRLKVRSETTFKGKKVMPITDWQFNALRNAGLRFAYYPIDKPTVAKHTSKPIEGKWFIEYREDSMDSYDIQEFTDYNKYITKLKFIESLRPQGSDIKRHGRL